MSKSVRPVYVMACFGIPSAIILLSFCPGLLRHESSLWFPLLGLAIGIIFGFSISVSKCCKIQYPLCFLSAAIGMALACLSYAPSGDEAGLCLLVITFSAGAFIVLLMRQTGKNILSHYLPVFIACTAIVALSSFLFDFVVLGLFWGGIMIIISASFACKYWAYTFGQTS